MRVKTRSVEETVAARAAGRVVTLRRLYGDRSIRALWVRVGALSSVRAEILLEALRRELDGEAWCPRDMGVARSPMGLCGMRCAWAAPYDAPRPECAECARLSVTWDGAVPETMTAWLT